jgi:Glycosyl hydrolase catalytic core
MREPIWASASLALLCCSLACSNGDASSSGGAGSSGLGGGDAGSLNAGGGALVNGSQGGSSSLSGSAGTAAIAGLSGGLGAVAAGAGGAGGATGGGAAIAGGAGLGNGGQAGSGVVTEPFKGVANAACADLPRLGASWWYNWVLAPGACKTGEFVPMIAGKAEKSVSAVQGALSQLKAAGHKTVLGFNEPNKADQSNLSVAQVVELWPAITADPQVRVGSPATSADAKAWFEDFMAQVEAKSLRVDFIAVHWYGWNAGSCNDAKELESYLTWAEKFKRPIWITEFGCMNASNPTADVVKNFYAAAIVMLARHASVERYAWYPWNLNNELVASGSLTALGNAFAQAPAQR